MFAISSTRVPDHSADHINERIRRETEDRIAYFASAGPEAIDRHLEDLDREWDIERALEANASTLALMGLTLGATVNEKWFIFPAVITGFLLQHSLQGWCPPVPIFRRLGYRTRTEIDYERYALKAIRGDFDDVQESGPGVYTRPEAERFLEKAER